MSEEKKTPYLTRWWNDMQGASMEEVVKKAGALSDAEFAENFGTKEQIAELMLSLELWMDKIKDICGKEMTIEEVLNIVREWKKNNEDNGKTA